MYKKILMSYFVLLSSTVLEPTVKKAFVRLSVPEAVPYLFLLTRSLLFTLWIVLTSNVDSNKNISNCRKCSQCHFWNSSQKKSRTKNAWWYKHLATVRRVFLYHEWSVSPILVYSSIRPCDLFICLLLIHMTFSLEIFSTWIAVIYPQKEALSQEEATRSYRWKPHDLLSASLRANCLDSSWSRVGLSTPRELARRLFLGKSWVLNVLEEHGRC